MLSIIPVSGLDVEPVSTLDGRGSSDTMRNRRGDRHVLQNDMLSALVKDSGIVRYIRWRECLGEWFQRGLRRSEKEGYIHRSERFGSCKQIPVTSRTKQALEFKVLMILAIPTFITLSVT